MLGALCPQAAKGKGEENKGNDVFLSKKEEKERRMVMWFPLDAVPLPRQTQDVLRLRGKEKEREGGGLCRHVRSEKEVRGELLCIFLAPTFPSHNQLPSPFSPITFANPIPAPFQSLSSRFPAIPTPYLHVEVENVLGVDELDALTDLADEHGARPLRQDEVVVDHAFEQLPAVHAVREAEECMNTIIIVIISSIKKWPQERKGSGHELF